MTVNYSYPSIRESLVQKYVLAVGSGSLLTRSPLRTSLQEQQQQRCCYNCAGTFTLISTTMTTPKPDVGTGDLCTFNVQHGFAEALLRGMRSSFLSDPDYNHLTQCETLDDVRLNLTETDYADALADTNALTPNTLQKAAVDKVRFLPCCQSSRAMAVIRRRLPVEGYLRRYSTGATTSVTMAFRLRPHSFVHDHLLDDS